MKKYLTTSSLLEKDFRTAGYCNGNAVRECILWSFMARNIIFQVYNFIRRILINKIIYKSMFSIFQNEVVAAISGVSSKLMERGIMLKM